MLNDLNTAAASLETTIRNATATLDAIGADSLQSALADLQRAADAARERLASAAAATRAILAGLGADLSTLTADLERDLSTSSRIAATVTVSADASAPEVGSEIAGDTSSAPIESNGPIDPPPAVATVATVPTTPTVQALTADSDADVDQLLAGEVVTLAACSPVEADADQGEADLGDAGRRQDEKGRDTRMKGGKGGRRRGKGS